jgi:hypothetical protein
VGFGGVAILRSRKLKRGEAGIWWARDGMLSRNTCNLRR